MTAGYGLLFGWLSLEAYWGYQMHALDMGNMGQAAWNTVHGHPFFFTNMRLHYAIEAWNTTTRLSFHVEPLFPFISLVYLVRPSPESLLVLQTMAIASGAPAVYWLARDQLESRILALLFAVVYLCFPALQAMNLYEFHAVALATPLLLYAFLFALRHQYAPFVLCSLAAVGTKEEIGLVVAIFGLYVAVINGDRKVGLGLAAFSGAWSLFAVLVIEHHYRQPGTLTYVRFRYGYAGHGLGAILRTAVFHPSVIAGKVLIWTKVRYLVRLLAPAGFLALLNPLTLLLGLPTLALNLLSQEPHMYSALGDNSAELIAVVMISAILGAKRLLRVLQFWFSRGRAIALLGLYVVLAVLWTQRSLGFLPGAANWQVASIGPHQRLADRFLRMVPATVPVSTQDQLDPHLSSRHYLYLLEDTGRIPPLASANYILLDASAPTYPLPSYQLHDRAVSFLRQPGWGVAAASDGLILLEYGAPAKTIPGSFYSFMNAGSTSGDHPLHGAFGHLKLLGYSVDHTDLANQYPANLDYRIFVQPTRPVRHNLQPVLFARMGGHVIQCNAQPLGLAWLPTTRWRPGYRYVIRMSPMQIDWQTFGTAQVYAGFRPAPTDPYRFSCDQMWKKHGPLWHVGSVTIGF